MNKNWKKLSIGTANHIEYYEYIVDDVTTLNLSGGNGEYDWIIEIRQNGRLRIKTTLNLKLTADEAKEKAFEKAAEVLNARINYDLNLQRLLLCEPRKTHVDLSEEEIHVITVALRQHYMKMVDDNGEPKNPEHAAFVDTLYPLWKKFEETDNEKKI